VKNPPKNFNFSDHFLTARYLGTSAEYFETAQVVRLQYERVGEVIRIRDQIGYEISYKNLAAFREEWDMNQIPDRYKAANPKFEDQNENN
jgi:hypothetical protein